MKQAPAEQIAMWIDDVVELEREALPRDHPRYTRIGGGALAEVRKRANASRDKLERRGAMPSMAEIKRLAWGDVDLDRLRATRMARDEATRILRALLSVGDDKVEALRDALLPLGETFNVS